MLVYDTQLAQFLLSGQLHKYPALRDCAVNLYGLPEREKLLEKYKIGKTLDTTKIPIEELEIDVKNDALDTEGIALKQVKLLKQKQMYDLAKTQFESLLATTEMEFNGMFINRDILEKNKQNLQRQKDECITSLNLLIKVYRDLEAFNFDSPTKLSLLFFGGSEKEDILEHVGQYKNGNDKYKKVDKIIVRKGLCSPLPEWKTKREGIYSTNEAVLSILSKGNNDAGKIATLMLKIRELDKQISTYYTSTEELIHEHDSCIHPEFSHCGYDKGNNEFGGGVISGRLSCRNPNVQNQPRAGENQLTKQHYTSRYGNEGCIIDFDYKGIEVYVFAFLTQDITLIEDLQKGIDVYKVNAAEAFNVLYKNVSKDQRQLSKRVILATVYGAGAFKVAAILGISVEMAQAMIDAFYARYPMTKMWQDNLVEQVKGDAQYIEKYTTIQQLQVQRSVYKSITGKEYYFETTDKPVYKNGKIVGYKGTGFNPPDIKNHPIQGLTADIVLMKIGQLWRKSIHHREKFLLINTVHDSIVIDCKNEHKEFACNFIQNELEYIKQPMKDIFNIDWNLDLKVDVKIGESWWECGIE